MWGNKSTTIRFLFGLGDHPNTFSPNHPLSHFTLRFKTHAIIFRRNEVHLTNMLISKVFSITSLGKSLEKP